MWMDGVAQLRAQTKEEQESKVEPSESKAKAKAKAMCHRQQKTRGTCNQQGRRKPQLTLSEVVQAKLSRDQQGSTLQVLHLSVRGSGRKYIGSCQCFGVGAHYAWLRHVGQADAQAGLISLFRAKADMVSAGWLQTRSALWASKPNFAPCQQARPGCSPPSRGGRGGRPMAKIPLIEIRTRQKQL